MTLGVQKTASDNLLQENKTVAERLNILFGGKKMSQPTAHGSLETLKPRPLVDAMETNKSLLKSKNHTSSQEVLYSTQRHVSV